MRELLDLVLRDFGVVAITIAVITVVCNLILGGLHDLDNRNTQLRKRTKTSTFNKRNQCQ